MVCIRFDNETIEYNETNFCFEIDLSFPMHHELANGSAATVPESTGLDSDELQQRFHSNGSTTPPPPSQVIAAGGTYTDNSWN